MRDARSHNMVHGPIAMRLTAVFLCVAAVSSAVTHLEAQTPDVAVTAMPEFVVVHPGSSLRVAVRLSIPEGWTVGWTNPGRRGTPIALSWHGERQVRAGRPVWPFPSLDTTGPVAANVYRGDLVVLTRFEIAADAPLGATVVRGTLSWGLCRESCALRQQSVTVSFRVDTTAAELLPGWAEWESAGVSFQPVRLRLRFVSAAYDRDSVRVTILLPGGPPSGSRLTFFPAGAGRTAIVVPIHTGRSAWWVRLPLQARDGVGRIAGLLVVDPVPGQPGNVAFRVDVHVRGRPR